MLVVILLIDNMIFGGVMKFDDVIVLLSGKIIEIFNMDVEGRFVLVDGIIYVK